MVHREEDEMRRMSEIHDILVFVVNSTEVDFSYLFSQQIGSEDMMFVLIKILLLAYRAERSGCNIHVGRSEANKV